MIDCSSYRTLAWEGVVGLEEDPRHHLDHFPRAIHRLNCLGHLYLKLPLQVPSHSTRFDSLGTKSTVMSRNRIFGANLIKTMLWIYINSRLKQINNPNNTSIAVVHEQKYSTVF